MVLIPFNHGLVVALRRIGKGWIKSSRRSWRAEIPVAARGEEPNADVAMSRSSASPLSDRPSHDSDAATLNDAADFAIEAWQPRRRYITGETEMTTMPTCKHLVISPTTSPTAAMLCVTCRGEGRNWTGYGAVLGRLCADGSIRQAHG